MEQQSPWDHFSLCLFTQTHRNAPGVESQLLQTPQGVLAAPEHSWSSPLAQGVLTWEGGFSLPPEDWNDPFYHLFSVFLEAQMSGPYSQISWAQGSLKAIQHCRQKCFKPRNNEGLYFDISELYPILTPSFILKSKLFVADIASLKKSRQCQTTKRKKWKIYWSTISAHFLLKKKENSSRPENLSASYSILSVSPASLGRRSLCGDGHGMAGNHSSPFHSRMERSL